MEFPKDFFGNQIKPGDFVLKARGSDYMSLLQVHGLTTRKMSCHRLKIKGHWDGQNYKMYAMKIKVYLNTQAHYHIVTPPQEIIDLFALDDFDGALTARARELLHI